MNKPAVIVSVTNDVATDQRIKRFCNALHEAGYDIVVTGRLLRGSLPPDDRPYRVRRVRHWFNRGALFYAEYNIRLFLFLLSARFDILHSNDLDTLPANYLASRIRKKRLLYDSHEYFTEVPELINRPRVKRIWESIEKYIFPRLEHITTVSNSISMAYLEKYGKQPCVIRNVPERENFTGTLSRSSFGLPDDKKLVILQGTGINRDRGAEEAVRAMEYVDDTVLVIAGRGDILPRLSREVGESPLLKERVVFIPTLPYGELMQLTALCDAGLSLDKDTNLNYRYSLPNKLFDYIAAGIPVVASPLPEVRLIIEEYNTGLVIDNHSPAEIAAKINSLLFDRPPAYWQENLRNAAMALNWENEKHKLLDIYNRLMPAPV
jgi:glycosyltransferase involved in cell wall biosynthesis